MVNQSIKNYMWVVWVFFIVFMVFGWSVGYGGNIDDPNPLDFNPEVCKCSDLANDNGIVVGKACMCESTEDWPGKVLVLFLTTDGVETMGTVLNGLEGLKIE